MFNHWIIKKASIGLLGLWCWGAAMAVSAGANPPARLGPCVLSGRPLSRLDINIIGPEKETGHWADMAAALIGFSAGDAFSPVDFQKSLDQLNGCGRFAEIRGDVLLDGDAVAVRYDLTVNRVVREIDVRIKGRDVVFESDILALLSVYPGQAFSPGQTERQKEIITDLFVSKGFPAPTIDITAIADKDDYRLLLKVTVDPGPWKGIAAIDITGNAAFSDLRLKSRMGTWRKHLLYGRATRLNERQLSRDVQALTAFYWRGGYPEATVEFTISETGQRDLAAVRVTVDEGPRYDVAFFGNDQLSGRTLKKELTLFEKGNRDGLGLRKSIRNMEARYRKAGFLEAEVSADVNLRQTEDKPIKDILFRVTEGRRTVVRSIDVRGNVAVGEKQIDKQILTRPRSWFNTGAYLPSVLAADIRALRRLYREEGFYHVEIADKTAFNEEKTAADIIIEINEQDRVRVSSVSFQGLRSLTKARAQRALRLSPGAVYAPEAVQQDGTALAALISETGHPHVQVTPAVSLSKDGLTADILYQIEQGPAVVMGRTFVCGNLRTREGVVRREMEMEENAPFSLTRMVKSQQNLRSLNIFKSVNFKPLGLREKDDRVHLLVETLEKKPFFIELDAGYNSEQGAGGRMALGDRNLLGLARDGQISGKISETGYRGELTLRSPRFLLTRTASVLNLYFEKSEAFNQDFGVRTRGAAFGLNRQWFPPFSTTLALDAEHRRQYPLSSSTADDDVYDRRRTVSLTPGILYDTRDNVIAPTSGLLGTGQVSFSRGIDSRPDEFIKYQGAVHAYFSPLDGLTLALTGRAGYIAPEYDSTPVAEDRLFFLGGISSVRGYAENLLLRDADGDPVGGRRSLSAAMEARFRIREVLSLVLFYDIGKLDRTYAAADTETRSAVGLGLGYRTPVGPLSLYYGYKLNRKPDESPGRLHFSIGYTF